MDHICVYQNIKYVLVLQRLLLCKRQKQQWGNGQLAIVMIMCVFSCLYETTRSDAVTHESNQIVVFFPSPHYIISQKPPTKTSSSPFFNQTPREVFWPPRHEAVVQVSRGDRSRLTSLHFNEFFSLSGRGTLFACLTCFCRPTSLPRDLYISPVKQLHYVQMIVLFFLLFFTVKKAKLQGPAGEHFYFIASVFSYTPPSCRCSALSSLSVSQSSSIWRGCSSCNFSGITSSFLFYGTSPTIKEFAINT